MKNIIAVLLVFSLVLVFTACKNENQPTEPVTEETGVPGAWVTNAQGEYQTTGRHYVMFDENEKPLTEVVTDENGSEKRQVVTTVVYDIATYPGATEAPSAAPGYTMSDKNFNWPSYKFLAAVPVLSEKVSDISYTKNDKGEIAIVYINDLSYEGFLKYIDECNAAGFVPEYGNNLPKEETDGEIYTYYSTANGLYLGITYNTNSAPYRNCDVKIIVSNYNVSE